MLRIPNFCYQYSKDTGTGKNIKDKIQATKSNQYNFKCLIGYKQCEITKRDFLEFEYPNSVNHTSGELLPGLGSSTQKM